MSDNEARMKEKELEEEIKSFEQEREKIRNIMGQVGGLPSNETHMVNAIFAILVLAVFAMSIVWGGRLRYLMIEIGILLLSLKFVYFLMAHTRLNHFQFWVLSSLEWRLDKIEKVLNTVRKKVEGEDNA